MKKHLLIFLLATASLSAQVTGLSGWNIFVDPGHSTTENMGVNGYSEAEETLQTALHLRQLLLSKTDIDTVWSSRYNDNVTVSLYERTDDANTRGAAWYHSIHSNAGGASANDVLLLWGMWGDGTPDPPVGGQAMSDIMVELLSDAMRIPQSPWGSTGDCPFYMGWTTYCQNNPGRPYLYVNRNTNMPSELSEQGHHTNPLQNQLDMNSDYTRMLAYSMFWTILDKFGIERPFPGILAGILTDAETGLRVNGATLTVNGQSYTTDSYESLFYQFSSDPDELHNGFYFFEDLPDSSFEVVVSAEGYYPDTLWVESLSQDFITFLDIDMFPNIPPMVVASYPTEGDTSFVPWDYAYFDFSRSMNTESVQAAFSIEPHVAGNLLFALNDTRMVFDPIDTLTALTDYTITIGATAADLGGHFIDGNEDGIEGDPWILHFRTAPLDTFPPQIAYTYPAENEQGVDVRPVINMVWDEELLRSSFNTAIVKLIRVEDEASVYCYLDHHVVNDQSLITLFPTTDLSIETLYEIRILPGIKDKLGNEIHSEIAIPFTTGNLGYSITSIDNFENNPLMYWWEIQSSGSNLGIVTDLTARDISTDHRVASEGSSTSLRIDYGWNPNASAWLIREYLSGGPPRNVHFNPNHLMQAWVFGDGGGNQFRFCVDDNIQGSSGTEVSPWFTVDWIGWQLVTWDMVADGTGTWIGDGNLDGTLEFDSIQLTHIPGQATIGTIFVDELRIANLIPVAVDETLAEQPETLALLPNYPNPFNPMTHFQFVVPERTLVEMRIFDLKGQLIDEVFQGSVAAGRHTTRWDASHVASGVYLVQLSAEGQIQTRKITVLK